MITYNDCMTKSEAASLGGKAVYRKYGSQYMKALGKSGQAAFKKLYKWKPAGTSGWALIRRSDESIVALVGSLPR